MSVSINVSAFSKKNKIFEKHLKAVKFCIENELSFPRETKEFFKGRVGGCDLEDFLAKDILKYIENGVSIALKTKSDDYGNRIIINVADIPQEADIIIIEKV